MKKIAALVILCFVLVSVYAQNHQSYFYNDKGQFLLDTTLTISKEQLLKWLRVEFNMVAGLSNIEFPTMYRDNNVQPPKHPIIVSFELDTSDIKNIKIISDSSNYDHAVIKGLQKQGSGIADRLNRYSSTAEKSKEIYYLAFKFELIDFYKKLRTDHAVPIIRNSSPLIEVNMH